MRFLLITFLLASCSLSKKIEREAKQSFFSNESISKSHLGVCIYDLEEKKYLYQHQAEKYFIPASNTKLFTLYAGLKYLGDSLIGLKYREYNDTLFIQGTGDPTFFHPDFVTNPVNDFLIHIKHRAGKKLSAPKIIIQQPDELFERYGEGWSWDDYTSGFMPERSRLPMYGNCARFYLETDRLKWTPHQFPFSLDSIEAKPSQLFSIARENESNRMKLIKSGKPFEKATIPIHQVNKLVPLLFMMLGYNAGILSSSTLTEKSSVPFNVVKSQPTDTILQIMMHRSDNFFSEQTLLMASDILLDKMSDSEIIDHVLQKDLTDIPQQPRWVDGSGLSRYNQFTPQSMVYIMQKLIAEFGLERVKKLFPTGRQGSLATYFVNDSGYVFAKTGTLSNNCNLSGLVITRKSKLLLFSLMVNNHPGDSYIVRREMEKFILALREQM